MCVHTCSTPVFVAIGTVPTNFPKSTKKYSILMDAVLSSKNNYSVQFNKCSLFQQSHDPHDNHLIQVTQSLQGKL